ncbi:MAG: OmpA family protein, partial [Bacteroidales bacterium]|nr:OmpA family protein [Bacteroidales bacterium]
DSTLAKKPEVKKDLPSPRDIIKALDTTKRYIPTVNPRSVTDYHARVDDPLRRTKLTVLPPDVKCDVCGEKDVWRKQVGEEFFVKSTDDKALITLVNTQGKTTYVDLAPNSAYSIMVQDVSTDGKAKLPTGVQKGDVLRKVVARDYILFECVPKLAELNDEQYINNLYFDFDESGLIKDAPRELDRLIIVAIKNPQVYFQIETNADERGSEEYNKALTDRRLQSVKSYVEKKGLDMSRVVGRSLGKSNPLIKGARTDEEHRLNRRAVINLINSQAQNVKKGDATYPAPEVNPLNNNEVSFMVQLGAFRTPLENPLSYYGDVVTNNPDLSITYYMDKDGYYKYNTGGIFKNIEDARALVVKLLNQKRECYISAFYKGQRITVSEALVILRHNNGGK